VHQLMVKRRRARSSHMQRKTTKGWGSQVHFITTLVTLTNPVLGNWEFMEKGMNPFVRALLPWPKHLSLGLNSQHYHVGDQAST
jgi:hypothetical protein